MYSCCNCSCCVYAFGKRLKACVPTTAARCMHTQRMPPLLAPVLLQCPSV